MKITELQKRFADYFIETGNATEAYKKSGYKVKSEAASKASSSRLLTNANLKQYITMKISEKDMQRIARQDEVLEFLTSVMRGELKEEYPLGLGMGEQTLVKKELEGKDRIKAAELLGKRYGLWVDKQKDNDKPGLRVEIDYGEDET